MQVDLDQSDLMLPTELFGLSNGEQGETRGVLKNSMLACSF